MRTLTASAVVIMILSSMMIDTAQAQDFNCTVSFFNAIGKRIARKTVDIGIPYLTDNFKQSDNDVSSITAVGDYCRVCTAYIYENSWSGRQGDIPTGDSFGYSLKVSTLDLKNFLSLDQKNGNTAPWSDIASSYRIVCLQD